MSGPHCATDVGSRRSAPEIISDAPRNAGGRRTSMTIGGALERRRRLSSFAVIEAFIGGDLSTL